MQFFSTLANNNFERCQERLSKAWPYLLIALGPILLLAYPVFMGKSLFWGIPALQFVPWRVYAFDQVMQGKLPFLNEFNGMGAPLIANYQLALFYPLTWISFPFYLIGDAPLLAWSNNLILLIHLILSGIGMAKLIKQWQGNRLGMVVGGLAFCLSGYWACRMGFFSIIWCGTWLPWEMYFANQLLDCKPFSRKDWGIFIDLVVVVVLQLLSGHAQITWYSLGIVSIWVCASIFLRRDIINPARKFILYGSACLLAIAISSIQLIPTAEFLLQSQRSSSVDYVKALSYSYWPWHLINFIMPNFFGTPADGSYWGYAAYWEDAVYMGIMPLLSAASTFWMILRPGQKLSDPASRARYRFLFIFGWLSIEIGVLLSLGYNTIIFPFLFKYVPTFDMFNAPARMMVIVIFFLSWFAGLGLSFWERPRAKQKIWFKRFIVGGFALIMAAIIARISVPLINPTVFIPVILFGASISLAFWLILKISNSVRNWKWGIAVYLFVLIDLLIPTLLFNPYIDTLFYQRNKSNQPPYQGRYFIDQNDEYILKYSKFLRFKDFSAPEDWSLMRSALLPDINILDGIQSASNFDPLVPGRFQTWLDRYDLADQVQRQTMLMDMDVSTLLVNNLRRSDSGVSPISLPHQGLVRWAGCIETADTPEKALDLTVANSNQGLAVIENNSSPLPGEINATCEKEQKAAIQIHQITADSVVLSVNDASLGWLWISYASYPGWNVSIDRLPAKLVSVNYLFMGVQVNAGNHLVEFHYQPQSFYWGMTLTFIGCGILIVLKLIQNMKMFHQGIS